MSDSSEKHWYLVQWHSKDQNRTRLVNKARLNGYFVADRLLENCYFEVSVTSDGKLSVKADDLTAEYLRDTLKASVEAWNQEALEWLESNSGYDNLDSFIDESSWESSEVRLTDSLQWYLDKGILVEWYHTYPEVK